MADIAVTIGVDIGQKVDPTAIAVVERQDRAGEDHHLVRHLERLPLGTSYPDVVRRLAAVVASVRARVERRTVTEPFFAERPFGAFDPDGHERALLGVVSREVEDRPRVALYVDGTGVGQPVVDLLAAAGVTPTAVYFTHGDRRTEERGQITLGKAWLVSHLQALLQTRRLHLPKTAEAEVLAKELLDYEIRADQDANDRYGAFKVGAHDDLVTALGLAIPPPPRRAVLL